MTQIIDFDLVNAVLEETGTREKRLRLLPSRVVVYFVLALALFESCSYRATWGKLTAALTKLSLTRPSVSSLSRARRRIGTAPLRRLFETLAGAVGLPGQPGVFYRGLRTVAIDGTCLHVPDEKQITWRYPKRAGDKLEFGYPLLRLLVLVECGTRALLAAAFGPETEGELSYAHRLLGALDRTMLLLADAGFDAALFLHDVAASGAQFLVRSSARRRPTITHRLPDSSYLARIGYGTLPGPLLLVRIIETQVTVTLADGTVRHEQWRLITSLLEHSRYPARELVDLYHERWQAETTYYSIKATMLDGRVLRSRSIPGIDQEVYALLTAYQALIRAAGDATFTQPGLDMDRISFTILIEAAADTITHRHRSPSRQLNRPPRNDRPNRAGRPPARTAPPPRQGPHPQKPHQQIQPKHRPASRNRANLQLPRRHHSLRRGACSPATALNATVLRRRSNGDHGEAKHPPEGGPERGGPPDRVQPPGRNVRGELPLHDDREHRPTERTAQLLEDPDRAGRPGNRRRRQPPVGAGQHRHDGGTHAEAADHQRPGEQQLAGVGGHPGVGERPDGGSDVTRATTKTGQHPDGEGELQCLQNPTFRASVGGGSHVPIGSRVPSWYGTRQARKHRT